MGRRLDIEIVTAMAVVGLCLATGTVLAWPGDPPPAPPAPAEPGSSRPLVVPRATDAPRAQRPSPSSTPKATPGPAAAALPSDFDGPAGSDTNLGPEPPSFGPAAASLPPAPALPAPAGVDAPAPSLSPASDLPAPVKTLDPLVEPAQGAAGHPKHAGTAAATAKGQAPGARTHPAQVPAPTLPPAPTPAATGEPPALSTAEAPGQAPAAAAAGQGQDDRRGFVIPVDQLPLGKQSLGLTVDVVAPQVLNINQVATLKVVVRNSGSSDAKGVVVRDELPESLTFLSSQPEAQRIDALLSWQLGTVAAGTERVITLSVKPTKVRPFDHAATVTMMAGGKSRTIVREPKLKVEQTSTSGKVLRGQPVHFQIAVSNPGDGPARGVTVQAKLSPGLRHESGEPNDQNLFEQTIDVIGPGERVTLDTLVADTLAGGEQSCLVVAQSPDVVAGSPDAKSLKAVTVVEPKLTLKIAGPEKRYTETLAPYDLTLENPGTAAARNVRVQVTLPLSGRLYQLPAGAQFNAQTRRLTWNRPQVDPGEKVVLSFQVRMGGVGIYTVAAEARADGVPQAKPDLFQTDVEGLADVNCTVSERRRVVDVDGETTYLIRVDNAGTKEATQLLVSAVLSENIEAVETVGTEEQAKYNKGQHAVVFPTIERLGPGKTLELGIKVRATKPGIASCRVYLVTQEMSEKIDAVARFTVVPTRVR